MERKDMAVAEAAGADGSGIYRAAMLHGLSGIF